MILLEFRFKISALHQIINHMDFQVKDSNGNILNEGDAVQLTRDLKVKGSSLNLKRGTVIKNIRLTNSDQEVECRVGKAQLVLKTQYLKKKN